MNIDDMNSAAFWFKAQRLPARLNDEQAAPLLGFKSHDMYRLRKAGLVKCLGGGPNNSVKYYATVEILERAADPKWLERASRAVSRRRRSSDE